MRMRLAMVVLALAWCPFPARSQSADAIDAPRISQQDFRKLVAAKHVMIVDTRNSEEFARSHIAGALPLPLEGRLTWPDEYEKTVAVLLKTRQPVVVYCAWHDEFTSARAALMLQARGVKGVRALRGGWNEWIGAGGAIVKGTT